MSNETPHSDLARYRLERWLKRIPLIYKSTQSKSKRQYLGSVLMQIVDHDQPPTEAQEQLLSFWYSAYLKKNQVLQDAARGLLS